jgi:hypothetical protein
MYIHVPDTGELGSFKCCSHNISGQAVVQAGQQQEKKHVALFHLPLPLLQKGLQVGERGRGRGVRERGLRRGTGHGGTVLGLKLHVLLEGVG